MSLAVENLTKKFSQETILNNVSFSIKDGHSVAILGQSGSGKTTLAKCLAMLESVTSGKIILDGIDTTKLNFNQKRHLRRKIQYVFQDQLMAMNPKKTAMQAINDVIRNFNLCQNEVNLEHILSDAKFKKSLLNRLPSELSGGERQRLGIVRAMLPCPKIMILDEVTSALNKSLKIDIMHTLMHYRKLHGTAIIFITHDEALAKTYFDTFITVQDGKISLANKL